MDKLKYFECKHNVGKGADGCLLFDPSDDNPLICDCCKCHRNFHTPPKHHVPELGACTKLGEHRIDGCQFFLPSDDNARSCQACSCHRSFHKPAIIVNLTSPSDSLSIPVFHPSPSSCGDVPLDTNDISIEPPSKKPKSDVVVKLEYPQTSEKSFEFDHESTTNQEVDYFELEYPGILGVPRKLKTNWEVLKKKYPEAEWGKFYPKKKL